MGKLISKSPLSGNVFKLSDVNLIVENKPQGEIILDSNGIFPVADYAKANVQVPAGSYDIYVTYNDDGSQSFDIQDATYKPDKLQLRIDETNNCQYMFYYYDGNDEVMAEMLRGLDTSNVTDMTQMFGYCSNLTSLDLSNFITTNVTRMVGMFADCSRLTNIIFPVNFGSAAANMNNMFYECDRLTSLDVSNFNTSNVTYMNDMFYWCSSLSSLDLSNFDTSKVINMSHMFSDCRKLTSLDLTSFDTSSNTTMSSMFWACYALTTLDLSHFNTSKVTDMNRAFGHCYNLTSLDLSGFDTSKVSDISYMFYECRSIPALDLSSFNISKPRNMSYLFYNCYNLATIQGTLDLYAATNVSSMFASTEALTGVTLKNIRKTLLIGSGTQYGHLWELPYLINAVKELWDLTDSDQQTLTIGSANLAKIADIYVKLIDITDEMTAQDPYAANKLPCIECESTDEGAMTLIAYAGLKN